MTGSDGQRRRKAGGGGSACPTVPSQSLSARAAVTWGACWGAACAEGTTEPRGTLGPLCCSPPALAARMGCLWALLQRADALGARVPRQTALARISAGLDLWALGAGGCNGCGGPKRKRWAIESRLCGGKGRRARRRATSALGASARLSTCSKHPAPHKHGGWDAWGPHMRCEGSAPAAQLRRQPRFAASRLRVPPVMPVQRGMAPPRLFSAPVEHQSSRSALLSQMHACFHLSLTDRRHLGASCSRTPCTPARFRSPVQLTLFPSAILCSTHFASAASHPLAHETWNRRLLPSPTTSARLPLAPPCCFCFRSAPPTTALRPHADPPPPPSCAALLLVSAKPVHGWRSVLHASENWTTVAAAAA